jgi:hypothetical protein
MRVCVATFLFFFLSNQIFAQNISGTWEGIFNADISNSNEPKSFFLHMELQQKGSQIAGKFYTADTSHNKQIDAIYPLTGNLDKTNTLNLFKLIKGNKESLHLSPQIADLFRLFTISYFKKDSSEYLSGKWYTSKKITGRSDSVAGSFLVKKIQTSLVEKSKQIVAEKKNNPSAETESPAIFIQENVISKYGNKNSLYNDRKDSIIQKITVSGSTTLTVEIYDNGEIDGDSISLYINDKSVISKAMLTTKPITYQFKVENNKQYKITLFAENLGLIPPNTAYMIIKSGKKEWRDIYLSTDYSNNSSILIDIKKE